MAADVYSFGIIMWELFYRSVPFAEHGFQYMWMLEDAIQSGTRPQVSGELPPFYAALMTKCWAPAPTDRPDYGQVLVELMKMTEILQISPENISAESNAFYSAHKMLSWKK